MKAIGVILSQFPRYDEAFILRELTVLAQGPQPLVIFSLKACRDRVIHDDALALLPKTVYAPFIFSRAVWRSHGFFLNRSPGAYWGAIAWIIRRHWKRPVILAKTLIFFPKTVHFARLLEERGIRHLHAFWATYPASAAVIVQRLTGIPYSLSAHAHDIYTVNPALVEKMRGARFVVTCTEENRRYLKSLMNGAGTVPIEVNYHGVDLTRFSPASKSTHGVCRILAVGSLFPCKGLETLIESCRLLKAEGLAFHCTIAGGGPLENTLRRLIRRYDLTQQVTIAGYITQEAVAGRYAQAHLFVLPLVSKIHWGIPNVLIEALATKTPVVCCDLPSLKELVEHGASGWIVPEQDPGALAQAVKHLWAHPALRGQLAQTGYQRVVEKFSLKVTGERLRGLFHEASSS